MKVTVRQLVIFALVIVFLTAFRAMRYYVGGRLQELGLLFALILFVYSAVVVALNDKRPCLGWNKWFFVPLGLIVYAMILPGYLWATNTGATILPSIMASREFLIILICPAIYFLYRMGLPVSDIEKAIHIALIFAVFSYITLRLTLPLESWWVSSDPHLKSLVVWDSVRGYRLKMPGTAFFLALYVAPLQIFRTTDPVMKAIWIATLSLAILGLVLIQGRAMTASIVMGVMLYLFFFASRARMALLVFALPAIIVVMYGAIDFYFQQTEALYRSGHGIRYVSYNIAFEQLNKFPLFGVGMNSKQSLSEQMLFGREFDSFDLGIVGIAFRYGLVGAVLHTVGALWVNARAIKGNWYYKDMHGYGNPIIIGLLAKVVTELVNYVLTSTYTTIPGLLMASMIIALSAIYKQEQGKQLREPTSSLAA